MPAVRVSVHAEECELAVAAGDEVVDAAVVAVAEAEMGEDVEQEVNDFRRPRTIH